MKSVQLGVLISGRGSNLEAIITHIDTSRLSAAVNIVISNTADARGLAIARQHHIPAIFIDPKSHASKSEYEDQIVKTLRHYQTELVVLAGYMSVVGNTILDAFRGRIMNIHPSLLPSFKGLHPQRQALNYGVKVSGCTVHFVDENLDGGPVIVQQAVPVHENDTEETLAERILKEEHQLYAKAIQLFAEGMLKITGRNVVIKQNE